MSTVANLSLQDGTIGDRVIPTESKTEVSPRAKARLAGFLFLVTIASGVFAQAFLADGLIVTGDAAATARNILANQSQVRAAFAIFMVEMACQTAFVALMYDLLKPVDPGIARVSAVFGYVGAGIKTMARLFFYAPLFVLLGNASYLAGFDAKQIEGIAYLMIRLDSQGAGIALIFFGVGTVLQGYLILRSSFLPRALGILTILGGAGWLFFIYPPLGNKLFVPVALAALLGSVVTIGWFLVRGVNERKWYQTAAASTSSVWR